MNEEALKKTVRTVNWTRAEQEALVYTYADRRTQLEGRLSAVLTCDKKNKLWTEIVESVNAISLQKRSVDQIRKKWADLKSQTKNKERKRREAMRGTGGGPPPPPLTELEEKIVGCLFDSVVDGLKGPTSSQIFDVHEENATSENPLPTTTNCDTVTISSPTQPDAIQEAASSSPTAPSTCNSNTLACKKKSMMYRKGKFAKRALSSDDDKYKRRMVELEEEKLVVKKKKLERETSYQEQKLKLHKETNEILRCILLQQQQHNNELSISPVFKLLEQ